MDNDWINYKELRIGIKIGYYYMRRLKGEEKRR